MKKKVADEIIKEYIKPLYGFAMNKTRSIEEAEELASRIILQVYEVLLKKDDFEDLNSYIFKIAHNVWAKYIHRKMNKSRNISIDNVSVATDLQVDKELLQSEMAGKLRLEIAFLSKQQREIVILYYYKGLKIKDISEKLNISEGTIKWHLYESKKEMKKGMEVMRKVGNLGINPIKFHNITHSGEPGEKGDTEYFFRKNITQNIAYAAYYEPMTIKEIAAELGIAPVFVEDEVSELEEYGFMNKLPGGKYQTNMLIIQETKERAEVLCNLYKKYADIVVEEYMLQLFNREEEFKKLNIYYPNNDFNLFLWSLIPYGMNDLYFPQLNKIDFKDVSVMRKDGGNYIAMASIYKDSIENEFNCYRTIGDMYRGSDELPIMGWQINTMWSNREFNWSDNVFSDYAGLYYFINGDLKENYTNIYMYRRLIDKGYLVKTEGGYKVNIVYFKDKNTTDKLKEIIPRPGNNLMNIGRELDQAVYQLEKIGQPIHMHKLIKNRSQNRLKSLTAYVLKNLVDRGLLKEPNKQDAKGISTILFMEGN